LPSGAFQVRFQRHGVPYAATYPTRELAEDAAPLLRTAALAGFGNAPATDDDPSPRSSPTRRPPLTTTHPHGAARRDARH